MRSKISSTSSSISLLGSSTLLLIVIFLCFKFWLFLIAICSPGDGYDTSTLLLFDNENLPARDNRTATLISIPIGLITKLVRWDAIYFVTVATRGLLYEQEWAWWGFPKFIELIGKSFTSAASTLTLSAISIAVSNICHLLSVIVLQQLAKELVNDQLQVKYGFTTAVLHVFAPAGLFLSAPYGESLYSLLSFSAIYFYHRSRSANANSYSRTWKDEMLLLAAGACFAGATLMRSNGILNGIIFAYDLVPLVFGRATLWRSFSGVRHASALCIAGLSIAAGFAFPQYLAYKEFCTNDLADDNYPSWCNSSLPSIYAYVQKHYWDVGFGRYWSIPNIPLFLLATPMLVVMLCSSTDVFREQKGSYVLKEALPLLRRIAVPQSILCILTFTSFHVQIITRLASGYPLIYLWLAEQIIEGRKSSWLGREVNMSKGIVKFMIIYATVQAGLFASFLPPA